MSKKRIVKKKPPQLLKVEIIEQETPISLFSKLNESLHTQITDEQITNLTSLNLINGKKIFSSNERYYFNEFFNLILDTDYNTTYEFLSKIKWKTYNEILKHLPTLKKARESLLLDIEISQSKIEIEEGLYACKFCHSKRTFTVDKQRRSADEPTSVILNCLDCGRYKEIF
jgi:DNA-directed RNA polymerase subunit M/transcription elongation factor TFIIS